MKAQKPIIEKLVIYDYPLPRPVYYAESRYRDGATYKSWCGISPAQTEKYPVKEIYKGAAATRKLWEIEFDNLSDTDKKLIVAVFPKVLNKDKTPIKSPREILERAIARVRFAFGVKCPRCGGDGRYPSKIDNGVCHKCHGSGITMPRLTDKKLAVIAKFFSEAEE